MTNEEFEKLVEAMARAMCSFHVGDEAVDSSITLKGKVVPFWSCWQEEARAAAKAAGLNPGVIVVPAEADGGMKFQGGLAIEDAMFQEGKLVFDAAGDCYAAMVAAALFQPAKAGEAA